MDEEIFYSKHPSLITLLTPILSWFFTCFAWGFCLEYFDLPGKNSHLKKAFYYFLLFIVVASLLRILAKIYRWWSTKIIVTSQQVIFRRGKWVKHGFNLGLGQLTEIVLEQHIGQRLLKIGDLILITKGGEKYTIFNVLEGKQLKELLANASV